MLIRLFIPLLFISSFFISSVQASTDDHKQANYQHILIWGDSLSAGYGIDIDQGWVNLLRTQLKDDVTVTNGSLSGETTSGGLNRLPDALKKHQPDLVILELGGNDGLRGFSPKRMQDNLEAMIELAQAKNAQVVLLGMRIPPNYGAAYSQRFEQSFADLAKQYNLPFNPFFLDKVALNKELMQSDNIHPNEKAQYQLFSNVWKTIETLFPKN